MRGEKQSLVILNLFSKKAQVALEFLTTYSWAFMIIKIENRGVAVHNVITASATLGLKKGEGEIITNNLMVSLTYCLLAGVIAFLFL